MRQRIDTESRMPVMSFFMFLILPSFYLWPCYPEVARGRNKEIRTRSITWQQPLPILIHLTHHPILSLLLSMEGWDQRTRRLGHSVYVESGPLDISSRPLFIWKFEAGKFNRPETNDAQDIVKTGVVGGRKVGKQEDARHTRIRF